MEIVRISQSNYIEFDRMVHRRITGTDEHQAFGENYILDDSIAKELNNPNLYVYGAVMDDKMVGWISLVYIPKVGKYMGRGHIYVDELWVDPSYRSKGIGAKLMGASDKLASNLHATGIRLYVSDTNDVAKTLYEHCGLTCTHEANFMEKNIDDIRKN